MNLYFSRIDQFNDPFEGSSTRPTLEGINIFLRNKGHDEAADNFAKIYRDARTRMFVNCWYLGNEESEAMWRLYCRDNTGVAIQTTYKSLTDSISNNEDIFMGKVSYIDYEKHNFPDANLFFPVMHKRIAFSHENEVRLVISKENTKDKNITGVHVDWEPAKYIQKVYVNPYAPVYYYETIVKIIGTFMPELSSKIEWSQMRAMPFYE